MLDLGIVWVCAQACEVIVYALEVRTLVGNREGHS
mgnify:CR=1 FL=1